MKWSIPAKTFLLGEYAALADASAFIVTTQPCFELSLVDNNALDGIHPDSPAGLWWKKQNFLDKSLSWYDPYQGCGGLGASSAQFIGSYRASCALHGISFSWEAMLEAYYQCAWNGQGIRPSGYDLIAQSHYGCVYINKQKQCVQQYPWPFPDLSFFLIHTGQKLATHHHLQQINLPTQKIETLSLLSDKAKTAFEHSDSALFVECVNQYHHQLKELHLVADHSLSLIETLKTHPELLAVKGCGALGADVLLVITASQHAPLVQKALLASKKKILATEADIFLQQK